MTQLGIAARWASGADLEAIVRLYRLLETEMVEIKSLWALSDGLAEPVAAAWEVALLDPAALVTVGTLDDQVFGFLLARSEPLLPQANQERIGVVRLVFTQAEARGVGVASAMLVHTLAELRRQGHRRFDAHVLPGHRIAKNFFEAAGFAARSIVMHRDDS